MDFKRKQRKLLWLIRASGAGLAVLVGVLIGAYVARLEIATFLAIEALARNGLPAATLRIAHLDSSRCVIEDIRLETDSFQLKIDRIDAQFDIRQAWSEQRLQTLRISGARLRYDLTGPSTFDPQELDDLLKEGLPFPLDSLEVEAASIHLLTDVGEISFDAELSLTNSDVFGIRGTLAAHSEFESLDLQIQIAELISFTAHASSPNLIATLASYGLQLGQLLPLAPDSSLECSSISIEAKGDFSGIAPLAIAVDIQLGPILYKDSNTSLTVDSVESSFVFESDHIRDINANIHLEEVEYSGYRIVNSSIEINAPSLQALSIAIPEFQWSSANGDHGAISTVIETQLNEDFTLAHINLSGQSSQLVAEAFELAPFEFSLEGNRDLASLTTSELAIQSHPWIHVKDLNARFANLATDHPSIELTANLVATADESSSFAPPITGSWKLMGSIQPNKQPQVIDLSIQAIDEHPLLTTPSFTLDGNGSLELEVRHWPDENQAAFTIAFEGTNLGANLASATFQGISANATLSSQAIPIPDLLSAANDLDSLIHLIAESTQYSLDFQGAAITASDSISMQWFSGRLQSENSGVQLQANLELGIGIANIENETIQQIALHCKISADARQANIETTGELLFEGESVSIQSSQSFDYSKPSLLSQGDYSINGIRLVSSDILSRHSQALDGAVLSAELRIDGSLQLDGDRWQTPATLTLSEGSIFYPAEDVSLDSIHANIAFESIANGITLPSQITIGKLTFGDIHGSDLLVQFELDDRNQLLVEKAQLRSFDGTLALDPFTLSLDDPQTTITLRFDRISIAPAMAMLDFFDGQITGRLNGALPISIVNGYPVLGEGFLELDQQSDAHFSYNAQGFFTQTDEIDALKKTFGDKLLELLGLEPNALLEDALANLSIHDLRLDLFSKDLPGTPMRIQLAGIAQTNNARIPLNITTNINGTVAELLNFLMRLNSLGLVSETGSF